MQYPIVIEWGDANTTTGVIVPDSPGAIAAADTSEDAVAAAVEEAQIQLEASAKRGDPVPTTTSFTTSFSTGIRPRCWSRSASSTPAAFRSPASRPLESCSTRNSPAKI